MSPAAGGITVTNPHLKRQDIADWTRAVNAARSALFPRRKQLHDLYDNIVLDAHVQSVLLSRTSQVANRQLRWFTKGKPEPEGKEDIYKTVIATPWFHRFIEGAMSAVPYGTTVLELVMKAGEVHDVAVVPRANVAPEQGLVLEDPYQYDKGIDYRNDPYWSRYLIEVGEPKNYGGLLVAAMYVLYKRGGFSNWAQYMEMFGMPLRKGTYNPYDDASRTKLTQALEQMGSASWIVLPEGSNVEFIAASNSSGTGSADLYDKNIERCNAEISKLFLGQTLTTESGDRGARSLGEVHQETKNDIAQADMRRMEFLLNYELRPRLVQLGYPLADGEFHFYEEATMPAKERIVVDAQVAQHVPIPDSYWYKTYGIPAPTAAELKAIAERKQAASIPAKAEERTKADPSTKEEVPQEEDEEDRAFAASLTAELDAYYGIKGPSFTAAAGDEAPKGVPAHIWDRIMRGIRNGEITQDSVDPELMQWIADAFTKQLLDGDSIADDTPLSPGEGPGVRALTPEHQRQLQVFSGFKTNAQLRKATDALYDANGQMVPWATFKKRILQIDQAYNVRYLKAEYNLAMANRRSIDRWNDAQRLKSVAPFIRYSTVGDERVRKAHADINGVIKHIDDPFWDVWWPPNGWNCRCTVISERSDKGGKPVPDDIVPPKTMFANNVGKNGVIFPKGHPYEEQASKPVRKEVEAMATDAMEALSAATKAGIVWTVRRMARELTDKVLRRAMMRQENAETASTALWKKRSAGYLKDSKKRVIPGLDSATDQVLKGYSGNGHNGLNMHLRGIRINSTVEPDIELIRAAMAKYPLQTAVLAYRDVKGSFAAKLLHVIQAMGVGQYIRLKGFTSTSIDPEVLTIRTSGQDTPKIAFRIHVPAGAPALYLEGIALIPAEYELLLAHNLRYRILGWEERAGITIVDLRIVP